MENWWCCLRILTTEGQNMFSPTNSYSLSVSFLTRVGVCNPGVDRFFLQTRRLFTKWQQRTVARMRRIPWPFVLHRVVLLTDGTSCSGVTLWLHQPKELKLFPKFNMTFFATKRQQCCFSVVRLWLPTGGCWQITILYPGCTLSTLSEPLLHPVDPFCFLLDSVFCLLIGYTALVAW